MSEIYIHIYILKYILSSFVKYKQAVEIAKFRPSSRRQTWIRSPPVMGPLTVISRAFLSRVSSPGLRRAYPCTQTLGFARRRRAATLNCARFARSHGDGETKRFFYETARLCFFFFS